MARDVNEIRRNGSDCLAKGVPCEASDLVLDSIRIFSRLGGAEFIGFGECVGGDWRLYAVQAYPGVGDIGRGQTPILVKIPEAAALPLACRRPIDRYNNLG